MYHIDQWKNKGLLPSEIKTSASDYSKNNALRIYKIYPEHKKYGYTEFL